MHLEALKLEQKKVFEKLKQFPEFYLVGGTGLALQMGHRISDDFDFFINQDYLPKNLIEKIRKVFKGFEIKFSLKHSEQVSVYINAVKMDFVKYRYSLIFKLVNFNGVKMASMSEIALMKASTLGGRARSKDYVDLYFILKKKIISLSEIIDNCDKKYGDEFNGRLFLEQLTYFEDISSNKIKIEFLKEKISAEQMQKFFEKEISKLKL